jgi:hypothetical protein
MVFNTFNFCSRASFSNAMLPVMATMKPRTPFPKTLLRKLVSRFGFDPDHRHSGPDGVSDHTSIVGLERTAFLVLGDNILDWENQVIFESTRSRPEVIFESTRVERFA